MAKHFLLYLFLVLPCISQAQSKEVLEKYIHSTLSYQHLKYNSERDSHLSIHEIKFNHCTMSYSIFKKIKDKTERFTVRIFLPGISKMAIKKGKEGFFVLSFTTNGKSIIKEYANGDLVHEKEQTIPLKKYDAKALDYVKKLKTTCQNKN